jgi:hypothetical protein
MINEHDIADMCNIKELEVADKFELEGKEYQLRNIFNEFAFVYDESGFIHRMSAFVKVKKK